MNMPKALYKRAFKEPKNTHVNPNPINATEPY